MLWNTSLAHAFTNTIFVCLGSAVMATFLGLILAFLTQCFRVPLSRFMATCVLGLVLIPVYVQATAWSAGFGVQGWFKLSQVSAALSPWRAIVSVIWIQGCAAVPVCFLFCVLGIHRSATASVRQALLDFGPWRAARCILFPSMVPWIAVCMLWTIATTGNDMVVTNLFQVPTLTETVYQQVQFEQVNSASTLVACSFAILIGTILMVGYSLSGAWDRDKRAEASDSFSLADSQAFRLQGLSRWWGCSLGLAIVSAVVLLPIGNLIVKAGWVATLADNQIHRSWSPMIVLQSIARTVTFEEELSWSLQLGLYSAVLSLVLAMGLTAFCRWSRWDAVVLGTMGCLLSLPGPMVNLAVIQLLDRSEPEWVGFLADRTLCAPILALQSRCWPIAFGILWLADQRFTSENQRQLTFDRVLPLSSRIWIRLRAMMRAMRIAFVVAFFVAFADLASYLLVQPPQVTTVAMRMFEMLHYGIKNRESGLALALVLLTIVPTWLLMRKTIR